MSQSPLSLALKVFLFQIPTPLNTMASRFIPRSFTVAACRPFTPAMQIRSYAKKSKKQAAAAAAASSSSDSEVVRVFDQSKLQDRMDGTIASLKEQFSTLRVGRANPGM